MDISLLLLLSFISVFHLSRADQPLEEAVIVPEKIRLLGGWSEANPKREDVQEAAKTAVENFNKKSKAKKYFKLINIKSAHTQVTNMINYKIEATIGKTKCLKSENADIESCIMSKKQLACKFAVTLNPRNDEHEVEKMSCKKID
ncbi:cystatin-C [Misgurnus anguillicaudatus]|uniref:cystatin-C n=1 Tax=Misgurnus anguillicaudatus TaxID=75329 RepID=UPI0024350923|nr:cystatin-C [Misgurnus anguillicaudatus]